ncbi:hypothetical protein GCM10023215_41910 [Pseudonocardia yuanmonensis]|uniref:Uncharacterized protein n=1 Tax=Pseudonocardia yuanmonensis TaxID=1095914 RepID=A0ABP8X5G3_9PSEU
MAALAGLDLEVVGHLVVALFVPTWLGALAICRYGRIEQRWAVADRSR